MIEILLVEDNPGDIRLAQETLTEYKLQNTIQVVNDGEQALAYLRREPPFEAVNVPDLLLLDLHLPKVDGLEVLEEIRADSALSQIPVVILSASRTDQEMLKRFGIPVQCIVPKPLTLDRYLAAVHCFSHLGLCIVKIASA